MAAAHAKENSLITEMSPYGRTGAYLPRANQMDRDRRANRDAV